MVIKQIEKDYTGSTIANNTKVRKENECESAIIEN